jgi:hypothetical protein
MYFQRIGSIINPDQPTIEALVKMHGNRKIVLYFTNEDVIWDEPFKLQKDKTKVRSLDEMLTALRVAYQGPWTANIRKRDEKPVAVRLP